MFQWFVIQRGRRRDLVSGEDVEEETEAAFFQEDGSPEPSARALCGARRPRRLALLAVAVVGALALGFLARASHTQPWGNDGEGFDSSKTIWETLKVNLCNKKEGWASFVQIFDCPNELPCVGPGGDCTKPKCCTEYGKVCYTKTSFYAACRSSCTKGFVDPNDPDGREWECKRLSKPGDHQEAEASGSTGSGSAVSTRSRAGCSQDGQDCSSTKCCAKPGEKCYSKNKYYATCKPSCTKGMDAWGGSWDCDDLGAESDDDASGAAAEDLSNCSKPGDDCRETKCCQNSDMKCYWKNKYYATCKTSCKEGSKDSLGETWSCDRLSDSADSTTIAPHPTQAENDDSTTIAPHPTQHSTCSNTGVNCKLTKCCQDEDMACLERDTHYATCRKKDLCIPGMIDDDNKQWTCKVEKAELPRIRA